MSADRTTGYGLWGHSRIRCDGHTDGHRCVDDAIGGFRQGIKHARAVARANGWQVAVRTQYAPNGFDLRDYCPEHLRAEA